MRRTWRCLAGLGIALAMCGLANAGADAAPAAPQVRAAAAPCGPTIWKAPGRPWRCTFADEFNGTALNTRRWQVSTTAENGLRGHGDCWVNSRRNIAVASGALHLTSRWVTPFICKSAKRPAYRAVATSGAVTTHDRFAQTYGRWEIRARFSRVTTQGSHGALWLYPQRHTYGPWPASGEIDIAEYFSKYPDRVIPYLHYRTTFRDPTVTNTGCMVADPWNFHRYGVVWTPGRIVISIDGRVCVNHYVRASRTRTTARPFDHAFTVNLTQALGIGRNKATGATPLPATTVVDYVRVWA